MQVYSVKMNFIGLIFFYLYALLDYNCRRYPLYEIITTQVTNVQYNDHDVACFNEPKCQHKTYTHITSVASLNTTESKRFVFYFFLIFLCPG